MFKSIKKKRLTKVRVHEHDGSYIVTFRVRGQWRGWIIHEAMDVLDALKKFDVMCEELKPNEIIGWPIENEAFKDVIRYVGL